MIDITPLAAYCAAYARWRTAEELLAPDGRRRPADGGPFGERTLGDARRNPLLRLPPPPRLTWCATPASSGWDPRPAPG
jgi:hypothetical protein